MSTANQSFIRRRTAAGLPLMTHDDDHDDYLSFSPEAMRLVYHLRILLHHRA